MYSATFAITIIFLIAVTNLAFGFTAALLCGRGPRRWSDVSRAITFRYFGQRASGGASADDASDAGAAAASSDESQPSMGQAEQTAPNAAIPAATVSAAPTPTGDSATGSSNDTNADETSNFFMPTPAPVEEPEDDRPVDVVLGEQLEQWKTGELGDEMPSATMLIIQRPDTLPADEAWPVLLDAIGRTIKDQLRSDRRVLTLAENEFLWFADDVPAEDALLPAQRIRHIIDHTEFVFEDASIQVQSSVAVIAVTFDDLPAAVLDRLHAASTFAVEQTTARVAWDMGTGPQEAEIVEVDLEPERQVLAS